MAIPDEIRAEFLPEGADAKSKREEEFLSDEQYQALQKSRKSKFKKHVHRVSIGLLYAFQIVGQTSAGATSSWMQATRRLRR